MTTIGKPQGTRWYNSFTRTINHLLSGKAMDNELPYYLWVLTRARTRGGKPPMKIVPVEYEHSGDKPVWAKTANGKLFALAQCDTTPEAAVVAMNRMIKLELFQEQAKLNRLTEKFTEACRAANKCFLKKTK
jgi:hypothetical protein